MSEQNRKTVVITGSSRGLGFEMAKVFRKNNFNVVINGVNENRLTEAAATLEQVDGAGKVCAYAGSVERTADLQGLMDHALANFGTVDIWINNAGVNQPDRPTWELTEAEIDAVLNIDLRGTVMGCSVAMRTMSKQHHGAIYNVEGHGSNDAHIMGLNMYGTGKRAVTYFTEGLTQEAEELNTGVLVGKLSPGIMITDFISNALGGKEHIDLPEKTKKVYNILGDRPDVVAEFLVDGMIKKTKNNAKIEWLTRGKAAWRFMTAGFNKRNFF